MSKHAHAVEFHNLGLYTFPVRYTKTADGKYIKKPVGAWRDVAMPKQSVNHQNYGVRLNSSYIILDVDVKNGKQGSATWLKLRAMLQDAAIIDDTKNRLVLGTMSGGRHHVFRVPPDIKIRKNPPDFPDVDFLSEGAFIVGPGTDFETGLPYEVLSGYIDALYIPDLPAEWLAVCVYRESAYRADDREFNNSRVAQSQFTTYCSTCPPAIAGARGDDTTYKTALAARDLGLDDAFCYRIMAKTYNPRCQPVWDHTNLQAIIEHAYTYAKFGAAAQDYSHLLENVTDAARAELDVSLAAEGYSWHYSKAGEPLDDNENNTICYLAAPSKGEFKNDLWGLFRYDAFRDRVEYTCAPPWYNPATALNVSGQVPNTVTEPEIGKLKHFLYQRYGYSADRGTIYRAVDFIARHMSYHPIRSWLNALVWDGVPRLDSWLPAYCGADDTKYTQVIGPKVFLGAVSRIMEPGCKMDYTLILEGEQGSGKSTVCEVMGVRPEWFATMRPEMDKDARQVLSQKWIVEFAEIDALSRRESSAVKSYMATAIDTYRPPYGRGPQDFPRQSIFIGTVNPGAGYAYLNDDTGGRRFWPVMTGDIDIPGFKRDIGQLYAEAMVRFRRGERRYAKREFDALLRTEVHRRQVVDPFVEALDTYRRKNSTEKQFNIQYLAVNVCEIPVAHYDARMRKRMLSAIAYLNWRVVGKLRQNVRVDGASAALDRFITGLPMRVIALRAALIEPERHSYKQLADLWGLKRNRADKMRVSACLRDLDGVNTVWDRVTRKTVVTFQPIIPVTDGDL